MKVTSMFHFEGGWPKSLDPTDVEKKILYRKKIEKDTSYVNTILNLGEVYLHAARLRVCNSDCLCQAHSRVGERFLGRTDRPTDESTTDTFFE